MSNIVKKDIEYSNNAKKRKNILTDRNANELSNILRDFDERLLHFENFVVLQSKLLNTNILRTAAIVDILIEKELITEEEIEKRTGEILYEVKLKAKEVKEEADTETVLNKLHSEDMGHA